MLVPICDGRLLFFMLDLCSIPTQFAFKFTVVFESLVFAPIEGECSRF